LREAATAFRQLQKLNDARSALRRQEDSRLVPVRPTSKVGRKKSATNGLRQKAGAYRETRHKVNGNGAVAARGFGMMRIRENGARAHGAATLFCLRRLGLDSPFFAVFGIFPDRPRLGRIQSARPELARIASDGAFWQDFSRLSPRLRAAKISHNSDFLMKSY
jgi:hypothetical protein